jgi:hypothetical protein
MILHAPHPDVVLCGRPVSAYRVYGFIGLGVALATTAWLSGRAGLALWLWGALAAAGLMTFILVAAATSVVRGADSLTYYHHHTAIVAVSAALLFILRLPLARALDVVVAALGIFLAFGRVGCFSVGCCHGRPARFGARYGAAHAAGGFPACYVDLPLLPVQLVEAIGVAALAALDVVLVARGAPPGLAFACHGLGYAVGRFVLEPLRGDAARRYLLGSSEAQWTAALWTAVIVGASRAGALPFRAWFLAAPAVIGAGLLWRAWRPSRLHSPGHVRQLAELLPALRVSAPGRLPLGQTSLGLRLSASQVQDGDRALDLYALSCPPRPLGARDARRLARLVARLGRYPTSPALHPGRSGVFHLLFARNDHAL